MSLLDDIMDVSEYRDTAQHVTADQQPYFIRISIDAAREEGWYFKEAQDFPADGEVTVAFKRGLDVVPVTFPYTITAAELRGLIRVALKLRG